MIPIFAAVALLSPVGSGPTLEKYLAEHQWSPQKKGPMLVVAPATVEPSNREGSLDSYDRKEFRVGSITAIAPTEMVLIDAELKDPPNLYDGLPRDFKVVYLMSTLDSGQWKIASGEGIGLGDLRPDQQAVMKSILPSTFTYENYRVYENNGLDAAPGLPPEVSLSPDDEAGVRLHFYKEISLGVTLQGDRGTSAYFLDMSDRKMVGKTISVRKDEAAEDRNSLFGVQIRKILPNAPKPSDLDYQSEALNPSLALPPKSDVHALCEAAGKACGLQILTDVRIANLPVATYGAIARAGDVLKALALCVTGTYRKVGDLYELTCDLDGIESKRLKLAMWKWELECETRLRANEWAQEIAAAGGIRSVNYPAGSPLNPDDAMETFMAQNAASQQTKTMSSGDLPPAWQPVFKKAMDRFAGSNQPIRTDVVQPNAQILWNFMLPDGRELRPERSTRSITSLVVPPPSRQNLPATYIWPLPVRPALAPAFAYATEDPEVAKALPALARAHGFQELWLQTWTPECLTAAIQAAKAASVQIRLTIKPWEVPPDSRSLDLDRSVLGETNSEAARRRVDTLNRLGSQYGSAPRLRVQDLIGPDNPSRISNWSRLLRLANTPGLAGVVLRDTEPRGYEPGLARPIFDARELTLPLDLGYTKDLRGRFLNDNQVDPVDIVDTRLNLGKLDLSLPFFGDPNYNGAGSVQSFQPQGAFQKWLLMRAEANWEAVAQFARQLTCPVLFEPRWAAQEIMTEPKVRLIPWNSSQTLPATDWPEMRSTFVMNMPGDYWMWEFGNPLPAPDASRLYERITDHIAHSEGLIAVDMASVPFDQLPKMLDTWFRAP